MTTKDGDVYRFDLTNGSREVALARGAAAGPIAVSSGAVAVGWDDAVTTVSDETGTVVTHQGDGRILRVVFDRTGRYVASGGQVPPILVADLKLQRLAHVYGHSDDITWLEFGPDSESLVSSSFDGVVRVTALDDLLWAPRAGLDAWLDEQTSLKFTEKKNVVNN